ncbi:MAG: lysylphosphatidylglycerol synthase domain-containing protein, partial [Prosthecobacter sp.]
CLAAIWPRWEALGHDAKLLLTGFSGFMGISFIGMIICWITLKPKVLAWGKQTFPRILGTAFFDRISSTLTTMHDVILALWRRALCSILISIAVYGFLFFTFYCALQAVGAHAPLLDVMTAMPVVDASATLPISLSGIGIREKTFEALLSSFAGVPESACVSAAFVGWLFTIFWGLIGGGMFLKSDGRPALARLSEPTTTL